MQRGPGFIRESLKRRVANPADQLCAVTDVGRVREHNEDAFYVSVERPIMIVADGMGGHAAGEVASALAVETLVEFFSSERCQAIEAGALPVERVLVDALELAHRRVAEAARTRVGCWGMATVIALAYVLGDQLYTGNVGDVRVYVQTTSGLELVTEDHSVVGALVLAGKLTAEEARRHPRRNEVLQAIGLPFGILPTVRSRRLTAGDYVLLCSDGLWEAFSEEEMSSLVVGAGSLFQRAVQLVERANAAGGPDNITVVLYEHRGPQQGGVRPVRAEG